VLDIYRREGLLTRAASVAKVWEDAAHGLKGRPHVIDIRNLGLMAAIELAPRDGAPGARAFEALNRALAAGVLIRVTGDTIALSPPLIISEAEIGMLFGVLGDVLETIA
jgi:beta-alanine--pyruvate transaminase